MNDSQNIQLPISAEDIMATFDLPVCMEVGMLIASLQHAISRGEITNDYDSIYNYLFEVAKRMKIIPQN